MTTTTTTTATTRSSFPLFRMSARAETFSEFQFMLSSNSLNVSAPVLTAAHASRDIQRIRINFHSDSLHLSARVLISHDLLSVHFSCAREPRHSSQIAKLKTRAETSNALGTAEYGAPEMSTRAEFSFLILFLISFGGCLEEFPLFRILICYRAREKLFRAGSRARPPPKRSKL